MSNEVKTQPHRDGDHFVSYRDTNGQVLAQIRSVDDMIVDEINEGRLGVEDAAELSRELRLGTYSPIDVMGMIVLNASADNPDFL